MDGSTLRGEARLKQGTEINQQINLTLAVDDGVKSYSFKKGFIGIRFFDNNKAGLSCNEYLNHFDESFVNITKLDWNERVIAGTFEFPMMVSGCQDTVSITEGRFDLKF